MKKIISLVIFVVVIAGLIIFSMDDSSVAELDATIVDELTYEENLFDNSFVHTIDIVVDEDEFDDLIDAAEDKEYISVDLVIDGELIENVGFRTKGNSSLRDLVKTDGEKYSFKIEFDHYVDSTLYYGLDKFVINNFYQDPTYLKDYLAYDMMNSVGVASPLTSYVFVTLNGEDYGLYLAVEALEDSFLERNDLDGALYKPETTNEEGGNDQQAAIGDDAVINDRVAMPGNVAMGGMAPAMLEDDKENISESNSGSDLAYTDDEYSSYSEIFDNAKTDITEQDMTEVIDALENISNNTNISESIDVTEVSKYFAVHNYLLNFDSYTGSILHNYYLYEDDGILEMLPWDYNLSFGTFDYKGNEDASIYVNYPIDDPTSVDIESRPLMEFILSEDIYSDEYYEQMASFISTYFSGDSFETEIDRIKEMIEPYVLRDTKGFTTITEFEAGVSALKEFCILRKDSILGQLDGSIPTTTEGQSISDSLIDASSINLSDLGSK